jgi:hypothetical protein
MKSVESRELQARFRSQHGLVARRNLRALGVTAEQERWCIQKGQWEVAGPGVIRLTGSPRTPEQDLLAACLGGGPTAVASHQSAAWLWALLDAPPRRRAITLARGTKCALPHVDVHRPVDYPANVISRRQIPATDPLRTLVDLAAVAPPRALDDAVDRALAKRLLTVTAIEAELARLGRNGRAGAGRMRQTLRRRGLIGAPHPSVLESRALRLLRQYGIEPLGTEVRWGPEGRYRVDIVLAPNVVMEVDGFAYHADPEQMGEDKRRRTRMRLEGTVVLEYTWRDILYDPQRVIAEVRQVLGTASAS